MIKDERCPSMFKMVKGEKIVVGKLGFDILCGVIVGVFGGSMFGALIFGMVGGIIAGIITGVVAFCVFRYC